MNNIHILRKKLIKIKSNYINKLHKAGVDISLSSLSSFRPLNFSNFGKRPYQIKLKNIEKKINLINFIYQVKNFLYILRFSSPQIFGNYSKKNINNYKTLIVSWSTEKDFLKTGEYFDKYFKISSKKKDTLWFLVHMGNEKPKKIKKNIIIFYNPQKKNGFNINLLIKYFFKIIRQKKFSLSKIYHELSFDSFIAHNMKDFFAKVLVYYWPKKIIFPYECQTFQSSLIHLIRKSNEKIITIGYNHSSHPFPMYNLYHSNSPDLLYVQSEASKKFFSKYFKWPQKKVKQISSLLVKKTAKEYAKKIFLPYGFSDANVVVKNFELFVNSYLQEKIKPMKIKTHPATINSKRHLELKKRIEHIIKINKNKFSENSNKSTSIHIGEVSTVIEALEAGVTAIHIVCDPIFELYSPKFWPSIKVRQLSDKIFEYSLKEFGKCLTFEKKKFLHNI